MPRYPISLEEALRRLSDKMNIEAMFQRDTVTHCYTIPREEVVHLLERCADQIDESGYFGQRCDMGIHVPLRHRTLGLGWMFLETRPEARRSSEEIDRREREAAANLGFPWSAEHWRAEEGLKMTVKRRRFRGRGCPRPSPPPVPVSLDAQADGVYVDVSIGGKAPGRRLGFVVQRGGVSSVFSTLGRKRGASKCEGEAVQIALRAFPGMPVFCDCKDVAAKHCVTHIPRKFNKLAHRAARESPNFIPRDELDRLLPPTKRN
jgi:hypothetical protein